MAEAHVEALGSSVVRLRDFGSRISEAGLTGRAYPREWSIADVLSHIGSGAVIMQRRLEDSLASRPTPDDLATGVWDTWNARLRHVQGTHDSRSQGVRCHAPQQARLPHLGTSRSPAIPLPPSRSRSPRCH